MSVNDNFSDQEFQRKIEAFKHGQKLVSKCKICGKGVKTEYFVSQGIICDTCQANLEQEERAGASRRVRAENHILRTQLEERDTVDYINNALKAKNELLEEENEKFRLQLGKHKKVKSFPIENPGKRKLNG